LGRAKKPILIFLMETKMIQRKVEFVRIKLGFDRVFVVHYKGKSGCLILLWNATTQVEIQNFNRRHINAVIKSKNDEPPWKFTGFYYHPVTAKRAEAWSLLRHLAKLCPEPWLCVDNFNEITSSSKKSSNTHVSNA
jgi:hypothetical protein